MGGIYFCPVVCIFLSSSFYQQHCMQRNAPVFNLLRGRFWGFSPHRGDTLHRWGEIWHAHYWSSVQRLGYRTTKTEIFSEIRSKCGIYTPHRGVSLAWFLQNLQSFYSVQDALAVKISLYLFKGLWSYGGFNKLTGSGYPQKLTTCISWHPQIRTGGFCSGKVLLPACPCWRQLVHY